MEDKQQEDIWMALAELFFLDTEPGDADFARVAATLKESGWDKTITETTLVHFIAPVAGANLGFLLWPVIGEWAGFDRADLCAKIRGVAARRQKHPDWYYFLSDWHCGRMLKTLGLQRLLEKF